MWKKCVEWGTLKVVAEQVNFWMPWVYPNDWNPDTYLTYEEPVINSQGRYLVSSVALKRGAD